MRASRAMEMMFSTDIKCQLMHYHRNLRTTHTIERLHEKFKRRIKTQTVLPLADTAAIVFWALLSSGQINMRKVDGRHPPATKLIDQPIDLAA